MNWAVILPIILAVVSYFVSKKSGAKDSKAAMVGAAAGLGSYYVATQTDWGKASVASIDKSWTNLVGTDGKPVTKADGTVVQAPAGATVETNTDGTPKTDASGNILWKAIDSTGKVLTSWGAAGTATVVGTTAAATGSGIFSNPVVKWGALGLAAFLILKD